MLTFTPLDAEQDAAPQASSELTFVPISEEPAKPEAPAATFVPLKKEEGSFTGELVKGAKGAAEYTIPSMGRQIALQGSADAMIAKQKQLALMDKIDSGEIKSLRDLKADPSYEELRSAGQNVGQLNAYFANRGVPEVAGKLRGGVQKDFTNMAQSTATQIDVLNRYAKEHKAKYGANVEKFTDINWTDPKVVSDFTQWLGYNMGAGATQLAPIMIAAAVAKQPGLLATSGAMGVSEAVGNRMKFIQNKTKGMPPEEQGKAIAEYVAKTGDANLITGLASGSFDLLLGPAAKAAKGTLAQATRELGKVGAMKAAAKELPKDVLQEGVTGGLQEATQIAAKKALAEEGKPITMQNVKDVIDAMASEAAGAPAGTVVNVGRAGLFTPSAPQEVPEVTPPSTVDELAAKLESQGFPAAEARKIAEARMAPPQESEADREARLEREAIQAENEPLTFVPLGEEGTPVPKAAPAEEAPTLESLTGEFMDQGLSEEEARVQAQLVLDREKPVVAAPPTPPSTIKTEAPPTQASVAAELMDQGYSEQEAQVLARLFMMRQEGQVAPTQGESRAARPDTTADRGSVAVPAQPAVSVPAATGAEGVEPTGVVSAGQDVGRVAEGEGAQPSALTAEEHPAVKLAREKAAEAEAIRAGAVDLTTERAQRRAIEQEVEAQMARLRDMVDRGLASDADIFEAQDLISSSDSAVEAGSKINQFLNQVEGRKRPTETPATTGEELGTEAPEAVQAEAQGQEEPTAPVTGKKRGRPAVLTPEEKAAREEQRKADRAERGRHERALSKAEAALQKASEPLDEGEFANDEELKEAQNDQRAERRNAIKELLKVSEESGLRPEGKRARQVLKDSGVPQTEIDDIKRGMERAKKALSEDKNNLLGPASARGAANTKADPAFSATKTGAQAIAHIIRTGNAFQQMFAQRIRNFVSNVRIVVLEKGDPVPEQLQTGKNAEHWEKSRALYIENFDTGDRVIYVRGASFGNSQGANNVTMLHELWHAATVKKIALAQMFIDQGINLNTPLVKAYNDLLNTMHAAQERFLELNDEGLLSPEVVDLADSTDFSIIADPREFVAYGMTDEEFQEFLMQAEGTIDQPNLFTRFVNGLRKLFGMPSNTINAMSDLLIASDSLLRARTPATTTLEGEVAAEQAVPPEEKKATERTAEELAKDVRIAKKKVAQSIMGTNAQAEGIKLMQLARDPGKVLEILKDLWTTASYTQRQVLVKLPTLDILADWAKDYGVPRIADIHRHVQEMNGMSVKFLEGAQQVIDGLRKVFKAHPQERPAVEALVYESTLAQYDPADPTLKVRSPELDADFNRLSKDSQNAYIMLRDYYENVHSMFRLLLDEQVNNLAEVSAEIKQNMMVMIRQAFETGDRIRPFFPLVRRGDFWVSVGKGPNRQFYMFENMAKRDAFAKTLKGDVKTGNDVGELRRFTQDASTLLKGLFDAIDNQDMTDADVKDGLKDAVYQIYLQTMPEQSFRKMFIHRKGISGFSTDLVRNTASTASRMATQLAKLKYAPILRNDLSAARSSIEGRPELTPFIQEAQRRVGAALSGVQGGLMDTVAGLANKASYLWFMSSASSALIQPFSIYISGLPVLAANHGGNWLGAARELGKMVTHMNQYGVTRKNADGTLSYASPSLANNTALPEDERRAVQAMTERGVQESTYASQVWGYARVPSANIDSIAGKGKRAADILIGGLMHNTERLTREAVYLASYRLGKKRGLSTEEAINQAVADTNEALSDYDVSNRPLWMQRGLGKIAFQFKMYPLHMLLLSATSFKRMLPFLNKEGKLAAAQKFFGLIGTSATLAGASGMMFFSPLMGLAGWIWKSLQDDDEWPEELKDKDFETWFRTVFLPEHFGDIKLGNVRLSDLIDRGPLNALTGWDISSRTSLNDLWGRDMKEMKTARESFTAWVIDTFGGPSVSLGLGMIDAYEAFAMGDYQKGIEKATPSVIRNLIIANKYADEGIKTARGSELVPKEAVTKGELFGQAIGFRPDRAAYAQAQAFKLTGIEQKVLNQRDTIMRKLNIAFKNENDENFERILDEEVTKFNAKNPENKIEAKDIMDSLKKQAQMRETAQAGVNITKKNARLMQEALDNVSDVLERPAK